MAAGHEAQLPADAPPHPLRYGPAAQDEAEQAEQADAPGSRGADYVMADREICLTRTDPETRKRYPEKVSTTALCGF